MAYRRTERVLHRLAARHAAIIAAAGELASEAGLDAVQIVPVAARAGIAAGTVYRYFPSKTELVSALVAAFSERELEAIDAAADAAPGPLSALAAAITTFAARALARRRLAFALIAEPVEPDMDAARRAYRQKLAAKFEILVRAALATGHLPDQEAVLAARALVGALIEALLGPLAPAPNGDAAQARVQVQTLTLMALRALGVVDARARGLVVQAAMPGPEP